jgi:putative lipoic acid-binding regulatory protein
MFTGLQEKLDNQEWPAFYMFKFIVPAAKENDLLMLFNNHTIEKKSSSNGNYVSVTSTYFMESAAEVIEVYRKAARIEGIVSL